MAELQKTYNAISKEFSESRAFAGKEFELFRPYLQPGQTIVDLGCGNGRLLQFLEREAQQWHHQAFYYIGIDNSAELLVEARKKYPDRDFKNGDFLKIPLKDDSTDLLFCIRAFHHIPSEKLQLKTLAEMKRSLKGNGILILTVWSLWQKTYWKELLKAFIRSIITLGAYSAKDLYIPWGTDKKRRYYHAFTRKELEKVVKKSGLKILELTAADPKNKNYDITLIAQK